MSDALDKVIELAKTDPQFIKTRSAKEGEDLIDIITHVDFAIWGRCLKKLTNIINVTPDGFSDCKTATLYKWAGAYWSEYEATWPSKIILKHLYNTLSQFRIEDKGKFLDNCQMAFNKIAFRCPTIDEVARKSLYATAEKKDNIFDPKRTGTTSQLFFKDGVLDISIANGQAQETFTPPNKNNYNTSVIDCEYSLLGEDSPPDVISLLDEFESIIFTPEGGKKQDVGMAARFWEVMGIVLTKGLTPQIMVWLWGDAGAGKSFIYEEIIQPLVVGTMHFKSIDEKIIANDHGSSYFYDARVLYYPDASKLRNSTIEDLKAITGDGKLATNRKYGKIEDKTLNPIPIIVTNNVPTDRDDSGAAAQRTVVLRFTGQDISTFRHHFTGIRTKYSKELKREIIKRALEGLRRYYAGICCGKYRAAALSSSIQDDAIRREIDIDNNPIIRWFLENYEVTNSQEDFINIDKLENHFACVRNNPEFKYADTKDVSKTIKHYIINKCKKPKWGKDENRRTENGQTRRVLFYITKKEQPSHRSEAFEAFQTKSKRALET